MCSKRRPDPSDPRPQGSSEHSPPAGVPPGPGARPWASDASIGGRSPASPPCTAESHRSGWSARSCPLPPRRCRPGPGGGALPSARPRWIEWSGHWGGGSGVRSVGGRGAEPLLRQRGGLGTTDRMPLGTPMSDPPVLGGMAPAACSPDPLDILGGGSGSAPSAGPLFLLSHAFTAAPFPTPPDPAATGEPPPPWGMWSALLSRVRGVLADGVVTDAEAPAPSPPSSGRIRM